MEITGTGPALFLVARNDGRAVFVDQTGLFQRAQIRLHNLLLVHLDFIVRSELADGRFALSWLFPGGQSSLVVPGFVLTSYTGVWLMPLGHRVVDTIRVVVEEHHRVARVWRYWLDPSRSRFLVTGNIRNSGSAGF